MAAPKVLAKFQAGFRLIAGEALNRIVDTINGASGSAMRMPVRNTLTGSSTSDQAGGLLLTAGAVHRFTTIATAGDSATLPAGAAGTYLVVNNADGTDSMDVFPNVGGTINGGATDAALAIANGVTTIFYAVTNLTWIANAT